MISFVGLIKKSRIRNRNSRRAEVTEDEDPVCADIDKERNKRNVEADPRLVDRAHQLRGHEAGSVNQVDKGCNFEISDACLNDVGFLREQPHDCARTEPGHERKYNRKPGNNTKRQCENLHDFAVLPGAVIMRGDDRTSADHAHAENMKNVVKAVCKRRC